jgi:hypothetical protein
MGLKTRWDAFDFGRRIGVLFLLLPVFLMPA